MLFRGFRDRNQAAEPAAESAQNESSKRASSIPDGAIVPIGASFLNVEGDISDFAKASLDTDAITKIVKGMHSMSAILIGSTTYGQILSPEQSRDLVGVIHEANPLLPIFAVMHGATATNAIAYGDKLADYAHVAGLVVSAPKYTRTDRANPQEMDDYLHLVGDHFDGSKPLMFYHIPGRCHGQGMSIEQLDRLLDKGHIQGMKYSGGDPEEFHSIAQRQADDFKLFLGSENLELMLGQGTHSARDKKVHLPDGAVHTSYNIFPGLGELIEMFKGDETADRKARFDVLYDMQTKAYAAKDAAKRNIPAGVGIAQFLFGYFSEDSRLPAHLMGSAMPTEEEFNRARDFLIAVKEGNHPSLKKAAEKGALPTLLPANADLSDRSYQDFKKIYVAR